MNCNRCKSALYAQCFTKGKCVVCGTKINTPHIPCEVVCEECSKITNRCQQCGADIGFIRGRRASLDFFDDDCGIDNIEFDKLMETFLATK